MVTELRPPLMARNGHTLEVILPCRVSDPGPGKQDIMSLTGQQKCKAVWHKPISLLCLVDVSPQRKLERFK